MNKVIFVQAVLASLKDEFEAGKVTKGKGKPFWYESQNVIYSVKVEESDTGCLRAYSRDLSEGEETYQKMEISNGGHVIEMKSESERNKKLNYKNVKKWQTLKDAFLVQPVTSEFEHDSPIWSQRLTHEGGNMGGGGPDDDDEEEEEEEGDQIDGVGGVVRRLQNRGFDFSSILKGFRGYSSNQGEILEVYRILRTKRDRLVITQVRREPTLNRKDQQTYALEGAFKFGQFLNVAKFEESRLAQKTPIDNKLFKWKKNNRLVTGDKKQNVTNYMFCFEKYCRGIVKEKQTNMKTVRQKTNEKGQNAGVETKTVVGNNYRVWHSENKNVANKADFDTLDKECVGGQEIAGWAKGVKITHCADKGITKLQQGEFVYITKEKDGKLEEASSENVELVFGVGIGVESSVQATDVESSVKTSVPLQQQPSDGSAVGPLRPGEEQSGSGLLVLTTSVLLLGVSYF